MFILEIDQANLMRKAIRPFVNMGDKANFNYSPSFAMLQTENRDLSVTALFLIKKSLICNKQRACFGINPITMYAILNYQVGGEWSLNITGDDVDRMMHINFRNATQKDLRSHDLYMHDMYMLKKAPCRRINLRYWEFGLGFTAVVGIRSGDFQNNLLLLSDGSGLLVNVCITHNQLKLSTMNKEIILTKENGECIIGGVPENEEPIEFSFSLEQLSAYHNASVMSSMVWILTPYYPEDPFMLNCPVGLLGNFMFLFPSNISRENSDWDLFSRY